MPDKGHCKHSDYGNCKLPDKEGQTCIGYEVCDDYEGKE